jgi:hypothetical protein
MESTPYRNSATPEHDREVALQKRLEELRNNGAERNQLEYQLADLRAQNHKRRLQLLGTVHVASPCPADWNAMVGDDTKRFCGSCQKHVFNLSAMTEVQAAHFVQTEKTACVRFYQRKDGTILTQDCPVGIKIRKRKNRFAAALAAGVGLAGAMAIATAAMRARPPAPNCVLRSNLEPPMPEVMGSIAPEPPPPPEVKLRDGILQSEVGPAPKLEKTPSKKKKLSAHEL